MTLRSGPQPAGAAIAPVPAAGGEIGEFIAADAVAARRMEQTLHMVKAGMPPKLIEAITGIGIGAGRGPDGRCVCGECPDYDGGPVAGPEDPSDPSTWN